MKKHKKGEKVYVNFNDGVKEVEILHVHRYGYLVNVSGLDYTMCFNEVSKEAKRMGGVPAIRTPSFQHD